MNLNSRKFLPLVGLFCLVRAWYCFSMKKKRLGFDIVLLGQIASGKDTQANILMGTYDLKPVESGKYWRTLAKSKSKEGDWLRRTTAKGLPAPVALMKKFIVDNLARKPKNKDLIFIGNPRLKPEAQLLNKLFKSRREDYIAFYITLPNREVKKRSLGRKRDALDEKYIKARIKWHKEQVSKTVKYFDSLGKLTKINGNQTIPKIAKDIEQVIKKHLS